MYRRSNSLSVLDRGAKFLSRSIEDMFELIAASMDECLTSAKRTAHFKVRPADKRRRRDVLASIESARGLRPN